MQSSGGLTDAWLFQGKDAILSGPAGGIVGAVQVSRRAGFDKIIGFDMGGTSTDVTHYAGPEYGFEREFVTEVAGVRLRAPMMKIHTVAAGVLKIAVENMANAIKHISVQRGYDVTEYTLCCFGGAGGQHACLVADALGMTRVFIHPLAGVLSAYGMGLADVRALRQKAVESQLSTASLEAVRPVFAELVSLARAEVEAQGISADRIQIKRTLHLKYDGTDTTLEIPLVLSLDLRSSIEPMDHAPQTIND